MAEAPSLYPPSPEQVPPELTAVSIGYRLRVLLTVVSLLFFFVIYAVLLYLAWLVAVWLWEWEVEGRVTLLYLIAKYGGLLAVGLFIAFLIRGLLKRHRAESEGWVELNPEMAPSLYAFVDRLCDELRAPRPAKVFVYPDVNAALVYDTSLLNLIVPPKKHLLIGLGLVNVVNLSEFKAVLAHEFGHFSQKSVGLDRYVYVVHRVIFDLLFERDKLDELLEAWRATDIRLSFPALILSFALYFTRWLLAGVYRIILRTQRSLMRQMEFNADDAAVVAAGSDAIIFALAKFDFAQACLQQAGELLAIAADQGLFTKDLFFHQSQLARRQRIRERNPKLGLPPDLPADPDRTVQVFQPDEQEERNDPFSTHPSNYARELNAKRFYVRCPIDQRPAWLLFDQAETIRYHVTMSFYRHMLEVTPKQVRSPDEVQRFLDAELVELETLDRYAGVYGRRTHFPVPMEQLPQMPALPEDRIRSFLKTWPDGEARAAGDRYQKALDRHQNLRMAVVHAALEDFDTVELGDESLSLDEAKRRLEQHEEELREAKSILYRKDTEFLQVHVCIARDLSGEGHWTREFFDRLRFQHTIDRITEQVEKLQFECFELLGELARAVQAAENKDQVRQHINVLRERYAGFRHQLQQLYATMEPVVPPKLPNVPAGKNLLDLVIQAAGPLPKPQDSQEVSFEDLWNLAMYGSKVCDRLAWLSRKAIVAFLKHCERMASVWSTRRTHKGKPAGANRPG